MDRNLRVAIVTGGGRGIGNAIVKELSKNGCEVCILDIEKSTCSCENFYSCDVSNRGDVSNVVSSIFNKYGQIDILINNAGITRDKTLLKMSDEDWHKVINVNLNGIYYMTKEVVPHLISSKKGRIVNIASIVGQTGAFGQTNYSASKAAVIGFSKSCALELAKYGITVNAICPGYVKTGMTDSIPSNVIDDIKKKILLHRLADVSEIASIVRFLVCDDSDYITGQCLNINGGLY